jgi:small subunit ribosomal protein S7
MSEDMKETKKENVEIEIKPDFNIKLFNKWSFVGIEVLDLGLKPYINLSPICVPRTNGYYHNNAFYKTKVSIIERFMNRIQVCGHKGKRHRVSSGHNTGKVLSHLNLMIKILEELENKTKENPIKVLVKAIENSSPREEVITIERAGARYAQAVDIAPQRRLDLVIRYMCQGAFQRTFNKKTTLKDCLVKEILAAYNNDMGSSVAIAKRQEIEKMAAAAK